MSGDINKSVSSRIMYNCAVTALVWIGQVILSKPKSLQAGLNSEVSFYFLRCQPMSYDAVCPTNLLITMQLQSQLVNITSYSFLHWSIKYQILSYVKSSFIKNIVQFLQILITLFIGTLINEQMSNYFHIYLLKACEFPLHV